MALALYRQLAPPTGVEHAVFARLTLAARAAPSSSAAAPPDLVVAAASRLDVYRLNEGSAAAGVAGADVEGDDAEAEAVSAVIACPSIWLALRCACAVPGVPCCV